MTSLIATHNLSDIIAATVSKVTIPFKQPMMFKGHKLTAREGYRLELLFADGTTGIGEASPLPGFSEESLDECLKQLKQVLAPMSLHQPIDLSKADAPSVAFALDCALAKITVRDATGTLTDEVPLLIGSNPQIEQEYLALKKPNKVKLKAARQPPELDAQLVEQLHKLNPKVACILDANQAWSSEEAGIFASKIPTNAIAYIEEPCASYAENISFYNATGIPIALDETLQNNGFEFQPQSGIAALVIKPSLVGSFARCLHFIKLAAENNIQTYLSSSFESPMAINQLAHLAQRWTPGQAAGLDTIKFLNIDALSITPIEQWHKGG